ncbi:hypothetical protein DPMN_035167 [Dreissena polymorpha]|uniref:Uncharacterized protein n=1 Tax=Dreissena polymorpha TaxID=45954 RepID=A0A9D4RMM9_DREPO|nr:hypothetical protein DPMN_035167 [Dreissena polymorpha]
MDETPMFFEMQGSNTVNPIVKKTISIRTTGSEKSLHSHCESCLHSQLDEIATCGGVKEKNHPYR